MTLARLLTLILMSLNYCDSLRRIQRNSSPMANKLGPAFHIEPPEQFLFSNDTGKHHFSVIYAKFNWVLHVIKTPIVITFVIWHDIWHLIIDDSYLVIFLVSGVCPYIKL